MSTDLSEADNQFYLGLYRCAVNEYQPKIEKRAGVKLGEIQVKHFCEYDQDFMRDLERIRPPLLHRLFRRSKKRAWLKEWREYLASTQSNRADGCAACFYRNTIYVSFSQGIRHHEVGMIYTAVHELTHALWERIEGKALHGRQDVLEAERGRFRLLVEGYSTYAELCWFLDTYPPNVRKDLWRVQDLPGGLHSRGKQRVAELVKQHGGHILLEIPKRWREL